MNLNRPVNLNRILSDLAENAETNEARAYEILGSRPGPGVDIIVRPEEPICGKWNLFASTPCGAAFVRKFWFVQPLTNHQYSHFLRQAGQWGLTVETQFTIERYD